MHARITQITTKRGRALRRGHGAPARAQAPAPPAPPPAHLAPEDRVREAGGPEDRASYTCSCGYVFEADVSTSVACPHCGASQAW